MAKTIYNYDPNANHKLIYSACSEIYDSIWTTCLDIDNFITELSLIKADYEDTESIIKVLNEVNDKIDSFVNNASGDIYEILKAESVGNVPAEKISMVKRYPEKTYHILKYAEIEMAMSIDEMSKISDLNFDKEKAEIWEQVHPVMSELFKKCTNYIKDGLTIVAKMKKLTKDL